MLTILQPVNPMTYQISQWYGKPKDEKLKGWYTELGLLDEKGEAVHNGIDFACPEGTPIIATHDGYITCYEANDGAKIMWVKNNALGIWTINIHLSDFAVKNNDFVKAGTMIAYSGNTGKYTTGAHLHFGIYPVNEKGEFVYKYVKGAVDPTPYLAKKFGDGSLIKNEIEPKVYWIWNARKWWIYNEKVFQDWMGIKVSKANINIVDLITFNFYPYAGRILRD